MQKKYNKTEPRVNCVYDIPLVIPPSVPQSIQNEMLDILRQVPFGKINIPLTTYRKVIGIQSDDMDQRLTTIGSVMGFNQDTNVFTVFIHKAEVERINECIKNPIATIQNSLTPDGKFKCIVKIIIEPGYGAAPVKEEVTTQELAAAEEEAKTPEKEQPKKAEKKPAKQKKEKDNAGSINKITIPDDVKNAIK